MSDEPTTGAAAEPRFQLIADVFAMPHSGMLQWQFNAGWWA